MFKFQHVARLSTDRAEVLEFVQFIDSGMTARLHYKLTQAANGLGNERFVEFSNVRGYRHAALYHCRSLVTELPFDEVVELLDSPWLETLKQDTVDTWKEHWKLHHYVVLSEDFGCFEFAAEACRGVFKETSLSQPKMP